VPLVESPKELAAGRYSPLPVADEPVGINFVADAVPTNVEFCEASIVKAVALEDCNANTPELSGVITTPADVDAFTVATILYYLL
jgi:hypothetical protein